MDPIILPTTDLVSTLQPFESNGARSIVIAASSLQGTELVDLFMDVGGTWVPLNDLSGSTVRLTAVVPMLVLEGGPRYAVTKTNTSTACGVFVSRQF